MRFICGTSELLEGLSNATRALAVRPAKPVLEGVFLETTEEGLFLTCTDGNLTIKSQVNAQIVQEGQVVLPGRLFTELMRKLPGREVDISVNEKMAASIRCMNSRATLSGMSPVDFPPIKPIEEGNSISLPQKNLKEMISKVIFAIATDESRQILTGCLLEVTQDEARLVGLDGFRLAMQRIHGNFLLPKGKDVMEAIIPGRVLGELGKILSDEDKPAMFTIDRTHLKVAFGKTELTTVLLAGEYINYKQILPGDWQTRVQTKRETLANAIERASLMAREGKNNLIRMHIDGNTMIITSNAELGDVLEEQEILLDGKSLDIAFNARYISDVIKNISDEELSLRFNSNVSPCVICPPEGDQYIYLVLPVRVFN
jgi:DNA polymerase-3 subunit beta